MKTTKLITLLLALLPFSVQMLTAQQLRRYEVKKPSEHNSRKQNYSSTLNAVIEKAKRQQTPGDSIVIYLPKGEYHFYEKGAQKREYYISNHDQLNPKTVGIVLEDMANTTLLGDDAKLIFHGRMLPIAMLRSTNCTIKGVSVDFDQPHIAQVKIVESNAQTGTIIAPEPWVNYRITNDSVFEVLCEGITIKPSWGVVFEDKTNRLVYNSGDRGCQTKGAIQLADGRVHMTKWKDNVLQPGMRFVMRGWGRPTPGVFLSHNTNTVLEDIKIHYAEGMGLLAQLCDNITLDGFSVCLKGDDDARAFTTQADATHFSGCKGAIISRNGLYEGMMDDAINVHGTYLKVVKRLDDKTLVGRYMHGQAWGFEWGRPGDDVQFVMANTMELVGDSNRVASIKPYDKEGIDGAREFLITFEQPLLTSINEQGAFGIENLTWTPRVVFSDNVIRNNRARGALFSTPKPTLVENNLFDHTSGTAILLCGDCNGWYETGACRNVIIRNNRFINALTSMYQFTNAVISIYPEIPQLDAQCSYFHGGKEGGIVIEDNVFETFDAPILYAKSVDGLIFRNNTIKHNTDFKPFHKNKSRFMLERVTNALIAE